MKEFTTLHGVSSEESGTMQQGMYEVDEMNPFGFSCSGRTADRADTLESPVFEKHLMAIIAACNAGVNPQSMLNDMSNEYRETEVILKDSYKSLMSLPTGCRDPRLSGVLLNTWYATVEHTSVTCNTFYAAQFWARLQTLLDSESAQEPARLSYENIQELCQLSELFSRSTCVYTSSNVLYAIVASAFMRLHDLILVPYIPNFDSNISGIISSDVIERRREWKRMRTVHAAYAPTFLKEVKKHNEYPEWDATGCLKMLIYDSSYEQVAAIWAGACYRHGFEKD